jgi:hypothetical protein
MRYVASLILFAATCCAGQDRKPVCRARIQGRLWPTEANFNQHAARQLYQRGELEMCSLVVWKYKWEHLSVNVRDLARGRPAAASHPAERLQTTASRRGTGASVSSR